ncbi:MULTISPECIES: HAD family acid phosphatase [unclassified Rhodococcus (in: high G+C Gram-positive bacteria)]|uniref:HAD family acid phosphatase n=1 Tax=unclassified Rhodococcus (in: high G+C Gram-positive bacteria) TaxID=192944 RepID=UPI001FCDF077|nr:MULTISPECIES: HAD family acid phosphatase [unclassified Rhodococcus (in: high G+C Gram-positive bacteria)]
MTGNERVVMFDLDGGLADLSEFAEYLTVGDAGGNRRQAWQRFFEHVGQAAVIEPGRDLVEAVAALGFVVVYSTTRPVSSAAQTRIWLSRNGFPSGRALLCRSREDYRSAVEVKAGHCRAVGRWLSAFVDDEPETVDALRFRGVRAHSFGELSGLRVRELRAMLTAGTGGRSTGHTMRRPRGQGHRDAPHRRRGAVT